MCLFKIGLFAWLNSRDGHWKFAHTAHGLYAIVFEGLRFASIQTLDDIFQFEQATWNRFRNANPIGAGITRNHSCLPDVEETTCRAAHDNEHEAIERRHTPIMSCNATEVRTVAVEDKTVVGVQQCKQHSGDANPQVHPYPVLRFPGQAAYEAGT